MPIIPFFSDEVIRLSTEIYDWVDNELQGGIWHERFAKLTLSERTALFMALCDAYGDSTED